MNIVPRVSADGTKTFFTLEWGRQKGSRLATGIFTYVKPKNKIERDYNIQSLKNLDLIKAQTLIDLQTKGRGFISPARMKENFLDFFDKYVKKNKSDKNRSLSCCFSQFKKFVFLQLCNDICCRYRHIVLRLNDQRVTKILTNLVL